MRRQIRRLAMAVMAGALLFAGLIAHPAYALQGDTDSVTIPVSVTTTGQGIPGETYTIKVEALDGAPAPVEDTVALQGSELKGDTYTGSFDISMKDATVGVYTYKVSEIAPEDSTGRGSYDTTVYYVQVTFEHPNGDMSKTDVIAAVHIGSLAGEKTDACAFTNAYANLPAGKSDPPVSKRIAGDTPVNKSTFTFVYEAIDGAPMPEGAVDGKIEATIDGEGEVEFGNAEYTQAGVYNYRCYEVNDGIDGYIYDTTVYTVRVVVTETVNGFNVERTIVNEKGDVADGLDFTNTYKAAAATPAVTKAANPDTSDTNNWLAVGVIAALGVALVYASRKTAKSAKDNEQK